MDTKPLLARMDEIRNLQPVEALLLPDCAAQPNAAL